MHYSNTRCVNESSADLASGVPRHSPPLIIYPLQYEDIAPPFKKSVLTHIFNLKAMPSLTDRRQIISFREIIIVSSDCQRVVSTVM